MLCPPGFGSCGRFWLCSREGNCSGAGVVVGLWGGFRLFLAPQGRCGLGQAPLLLQPWSGHKSPGRGTGTPGASLGVGEVLGKGQVTNPLGERQELLGHPWEGTTRTCHPGRLIQDFQGEELGEQCENLAHWGCPLGTRIPRDRPPAPSQRVQTGGLGGMCPHPWPGHPPDSPSPYSP